MTVLIKKAAKKAFYYCFLMAISVPSMGQTQSSDEDYCKQSISESLVPIRPGISGEQDFWNAKSTMFKHAPSFNNNNKSWLFSEPRVYRYTAFSFVDKQDYIFMAETPFETLSPIWEKLPDGRVYLKVEGISSNGEDIELAGSRMFYKAPVFCPPYPAAKYSYADALSKGLHFFYNPKKVYSR